MSLSHLFKLIMIIKSCCLIIMNNNCPSAMYIGAKASYPIAFIHPCVIEVVSLSLCKSFSCIFCKFLSYMYVYEWNQSSMIRIFYFEKHYLHIV